MALTYNFKTKPYPHQVKALRKLLSTGHGGALLMAPRTGKTKVLIDWVSILHQGGKCDRVLVICPVSVMGVWEREIGIHCPWDHRILIWDRKARKDTPLPPWGTGLLDFVVVNYDAFSVAGDIRGYDKHGNAIRAKRGGRYAVQAALTKWSPHAVILDESHRIKKPKAAKTGRVARVAWRFDRSQKPVEELVPYRAIATGTIITGRRKVADVWTQLRFVNPKNRLVSDRTYGDIRTEFQVEIERRDANGKLLPYRTWIRNKNMDLFKRLLHEDAYSITRQEAFPHLIRLPDNIIPVQLTGHSAEAYDQMAEQFVAMLKSGEIVEASIKLVQTMRLHQIASGIAKTSPTPQKPEGRLVRIGTDKLDALMDRLEDLWEADEKVVIGANFVPDIVSIVKEVKGKATRQNRVKVWPHFGRIKPKQRTLFIEQFQQYDGPGVFVMQPQTGSLGIDLSAASIGIWYSMGNSWVDFSQMEDRIALAPQHAWEYLMAAPTDRVLYESHKQDTDVTDYVTKSPDSLLRT